ncbi:SusD/RagB family nutrient-binding outer membrane lipoprotein [Marinilongibacter aquaticus]|uniref:SusD/RagB family nutrient-binding outer membrane lipoprotein n=1 Tax=Marinilongibacter aquaticus TaxID=2975157 RepID=UPI0021BDCFBD|nr:SusD/RagB family nutrient-binding outer membrane lipoprotein [Marinilongibacter aquaticus]UBM60190.1 SusD/RagB family nutrient-binding outer membrane lipoprotein [Marinilongibacter aquaticus]
MKKITYSLLILLSAGLFACKESAFEEAYPDPAKIADTTVEKQFTGFLFAANDYYVPKYRNYFVTLRTTLNHYNQITGWVNETGQYVPGSSGSEDVWYNYYNTMAQYRALENVYADLTDAEQSERKIFMLAAKVFLYDYTQRVVDLYGNIPFSEAGMLSANGGDYTNSYAKFDSGESIYSTMISDLKSIAEELNGIQLNAGFQTSFTTQDYINGGDVEAWKKYCNSLRLRILNRVSGTSEFSSDAQSQMAEIFGNPGTYPVVESNNENILIDIHDVNSPINSKDLDQTFNSGLTWYINTSGKALIDFLNTNGDPRREFLFEPGENAEGEFIGIDQMAPANEQTSIAADGQIAILNRSTFNYNWYFPGTVITATEVDLIKAEYYAKNGDNASAKSAYEKAIGESVDFYYYIRSLSTDNTVPLQDAPSAAAVSDYLAMDGVSWDDNTDKMALILNQKWVHFNLVQPYELWAENRRMDKFNFSFWVDNANKQTQPPLRWTIPGNEITYNGENYKLISGDDDLNNKLFWDAN